MGILNDENGSSLIETLVSMLILGIVVVIFFSIYIKIFTNPILVYKSEALSMANQEVMNSINKKVCSDTSYYNLNNNLLVERVIEGTNGLYKVQVTVSYSQGQKNLVTLSGEFVK